MADATVIKEFLVGLGFQVDAGSQGRMTGAINTVTARAVAMGQAFERSAETIVNAVARIAVGLEQLYYVSRRTGDSVADIRAFGYAISQMGGTASGAVQSLENLARFLRSSPGAAGALRSLGIDPEQIRGSTQQMLALGNAFRNMPYFRAQQYANLFGIDERTLQALINGVGEFGKEYQDAARIIGVNSDQAAEHSRFFMQRLRALGDVVELILTKVGSELAGQVGSDLEKFRKLILDNSDAITLGIKTLAQSILFIGDVAVRMLTSLVRGIRDIADWFNRTDPEFQQAVKTIGLIAGAFALLNAAINRSPLGILTSLIAALTILYDDYAAWKEGREHFIDWDKWAPEVQRAWEAFKRIAGVIDEAVQAIGGWHLVANAFLIYMTGRWVFGIVGAIARVTAAFTAASVAAGTATAGTFASIAGLIARFAARFGPLGTFLAIMKPTETARDEDEPQVAAERAKRQANPAAYNQKNLEIMAHEAMEFFKSKGWSTEQAAGIAANIWKESGFRMGAVGDNGQAQGLAQWHKDRRDLAERVMGKKWQDFTYMDQLEFIDWELKNSEKRAGDRLRTQTTARGSAGVVSSDYERPADTQGEMTERGNMADHLMTEPWSKPTLPADQGGGNTVTMSQTNNITVNGSTNPHETAQAIADRMNRVNADQQRNMQSAVQ